MTIKQTIVALLGVLLCTVTAVTAQQGTRVRVGVLPVFDATGDNYGEQYAQNMTFMLYKELLKTQFEPTLLNPGALYNPIQTEWFTEYGQEMKADVVIVTTLNRTDKPKQGKWTLHANTIFYNVVTGKASAPIAHSYHIDRKEVGVEVGYHPMFFWITDDGGSRPFEKQPLGKVAAMMTREVVSELASALPALAPGASGTLANPAPGTCNVQFGVAYSSKKARSQAYNLIANGRELSLFVKDGVTEIPARSGQLMLQITVSDAPYKLPVQHLYQLNTVVDCMQQARSLLLDIGGNGEAQLRWR